MAAPARTVALPLMLVWFAASRLMACVSPAGATTVTVPGDFPTVQAVVDVARAQGIDSILVSAHAEPSPLYIHHTPLTIIGLPDLHGDLPVLPQTTILESDFYFKDLRFSGSIEHWGDTVFQGCELDAGFASIGSGNHPASLRFTNCTLRGDFGFIHDVTIDSCEIVGRVGLDYQTDGNLVIRNCTFRGPGNFAVAFHGSSGCRIEDNVIRGYDSGISANADDSEILLRNNLIEDCPGVALQVHSSSSGRGLISENRVRNCGVGVHASYANVDVKNSLILDSAFDGILFRGWGSVVGNVIGRSGGAGVHVTPKDLVDVIVRNNTSYGSGGSGFVVGSDIYPGATTRLEANIGYGNRGFGVFVEPGSPVSGISCNDWFANSLGATSGISPSATDLAIDPDFCNLTENDAHLIAGSPLLDAVGCGLIGALGQGCTTTATLDARLTAERLLDGVHLRWDWAESTAIALERAEALAGPWATINAELSRDADATVALDRDVLPGREYWYRLRAFDRGGQETFGEPVFVPTTSAAGFQLLGVTPNPGHGPLRITFSLPRAASIELDVFDVLGRHVASLARGPHAAGVRTAEWLGRESAAPASPGIYLVRYRHPDGRQVRRVVLAR